MKKVSYIGIFFDEETKESLIKSQRDMLPVIAPNMHCTFKYMPSKKEVQSFFKTLGNKNIELQVIGYASNGINSGFSLNLTAEQNSVYTNDISLDDIRQMRPAHITVSMAEGALAVNTGYLNFQNLNEPFMISGRAGVLMKDKDRGREWVEFENPYKTIDYDEI